MGYFKSKYYLIANNINVSFNENQLTQ